MKGLLVISILVLSVNASIAFGQCDTSVKFSADGKRPIAVYGLMKDYREYTNRRYVGRIAHIQYDNESGAEITGFALERDNGIRESIDITHDDCVSELSSLERQWLPYLIRKGLRVRVDAEISGSGGYINARNIILIESTKKPK